MAASPRLQSTPGSLVTAPSVSAEMEAIFLDATGLASTHRTGEAMTAAASRVEPVGPRRPRVSATAFGALAALVLAGLSAGAVVVSQQQGAASAPAAPVLAAANPAVSPSGSLLPADASATPQTPTAAAAAPGHRPIVAVSAPHRRAAHARAGARPTPADLMAADRRLRRAYAQAVSAGVPRPILADYRNRWADLRQEANWRPDRVRVGYAAMAKDLTRMSTSPHRRRASRGQGR